MIDKVAIVGGGLSAVYAYYGARQAGFHPRTIEMLVSGFSSRLGAIFMYSSPIEWKKVSVDNILLGSCGAYAEKQWGNKLLRTSAHKRFFDGKKSTVTEQLYDWDGLYQTLWDLIPIIKRIDPLSEEELENLKAKYRAVICTFPNLDVKKEYEAGGLLTTIPICFERPDQSSPNYEVIYNGLPEIPWVRKTIMPGRIYTEFPNFMGDMAVREFLTQRRPRSEITISRIPDIHPKAFTLGWNERKEGNLLRVGRQAIFGPRYLSSEAQEDTRRFLIEL